MKRSRPFRELELEFLRDRESAKEYLKISAESTQKDGDDAAFIRALSLVIEAQGGRNQDTTKTQVF